MDMIDLVFIPLIIGITELSKNIGVPKKFLPLIGLFLGVIIGVLFIEPNNIKNGILIGVIIGLSSSGLYSGAKTITKKQEEK